LGDGNSSLKRRLSDKEKAEALRKIREGGVRVFTPSVDFEGKVSYPEAGRVFGESKEFLDKLVEENILEKFTIRSVPTCPKDNLLLQPLLVCPQCGSSELKKKLVVQDGLSRKLRLVDREQVLSQDVDVKGVFFECEACGSRFPAPSIKLYCPKCNMEYKVEEAELMKLEGYSVVAKALEVDKKVEELKSVIRGVMVEKGFRLENAPVEGKSGVKHTFDLHFVKEVDGKSFPVGVDVIVKEEGVSLNDMLPSIIKSHDISSHMIIVAMPSTDLSCKHVCLYYKNLFVVEGKSIEEVRRALEKLNVADIA